MASARVYSLGRPAGRRAVSQSVKDQMGEHFKPGRLFVYSFIRGEPGRLSESFFEARGERRPKIYIHCIYIFLSPRFLLSKKEKEKSVFFSLLFSPGEVICSGRGARCHGRWGTELRLE